MSFMNYTSRPALTYTRKNSLRFTLRRRRLSLLLPQITEVYRRHGRVSIVDIWRTQRYWSLVPAAVLHDNNVHITIVNLPGAPARKDEGRFSFVEADGCDLSRFPDRSFHIAHSNSVLEHVGDGDRMRKFSSELARISEKYFVQTPSYWFPIEPHSMAPFFHWLPKPLQVWLVMHAAVGRWRRTPAADSAVELLESVRLLDKKTVATLFGEATVHTERFFLLPKSYIAIRG